MRALGRVTGRKLRGQRVVNAGIEGVSATAKVTSRAVRSLWLQVTGFFFAVFAVVIGFATEREYRLAGAEHAKFYAGIFFTLMFAWFAITSFWKARR
jgi:hypothetical protein